MTERDSERLFTYHNATKHTHDSVFRSAHTLDWANMPDPFRHYEGVPVVDLPADPPPLQTPALDVLRGVAGTGDSRSGAHWLSQLFFHAAAVSASKLAPSGTRYALRVNPSSGNLHPTEFHFATRQLNNWPDGLYHYRPSSHMAEQRATGPTALTSAPLTILLTTIAWREAWKYRSRAYRYCLLDAGHAWQALELAARAMGATAHGAGSFDDDELAHACGLEDEWPMLIVRFEGDSIPRGHSEAAAQWFGGAPNRLSAVEKQYPLIDEIHAATKRLAEKPVARFVEASPSGPANIALRPTASPDRPFGPVARQRRSALDFRGGSQTISFEQLSTLLDVCMRPLRADFGGLVHLYLYVHRVDGLAPGVYRHWRGNRSLQLIRQGDQRLMAAALSLGQDLAGNACFAVSMIADLQRAALTHGNRGYRYAHYEAGAIGHRIYLAAEAMGFQCTGIGAFYDDEVHRYLEIAPDEGQVIYHFAAGFAVPDNRLRG